MPDQPEQQSDAPAEEPQVDQSGSVLSFHVGDTRQVGAVAPPLTLRTPKARPPFGVDDEGTPRPDPTLAPAAEPEPEPAPEPRGSRAAPEKAPEKPPAAR